MRSRKDRKMDERGVSTIIGTGITLIVLLMAASIFLTSFRSYRQETQKAEEINNERIANTIHTNLEIENVFYYSSGDNLVIKSTNSGSTVLEVSKLLILLDGQRVKDGEIVSVLVDNVQTDIWVPEESLEIEVENVFNQPQRIKLVTKYGVSDYFTEVENVGG